MSSAEERRSLRDKAREERKNRLSDRRARRAKSMRGKTQDLLEKSEPEAVAEPAAETPAEKPHPKKSRAEELREKRRKREARKRKSTKKKEAAKPPEPPTKAAVEADDEPPPAFMGGDPDEEPSYMMADPDEEPSYMMADPDEAPSYMMADPDEEPAYMAADPDAEPAYMTADADADSVAMPADAGAVGLVAGGGVEPGSEAEATADEGEPAPGQAPARSAAKTAEARPRVLGLGDLKLGERAYPEGDVAAAYEFFAAIIRSVGIFHEQAFQINCLGVKHFRKGARVAPSVSSYTDTVVLLYRDEDGNPWAEEFSAKLDPPPACWNDGRRSLHLCDGQYEFALDTWNNMPTLVQSGAVSVWRDPDPWRARRDDPIVKTGQFGVCLRWGDDPEQPPENPEGHQLLRGGRGSSSWSHFIKTASLDRDRKVPYTLVDSARLLASGGAQTAIVGTPPGFGPAVAMFEDDGSFAEVPLASDLEGQFREWKGLPADVWRESCPQAWLGSDFEADYLGVLHACRRSGAALIVGSGRRTHIQQVSSDTSPTSLHYLGRALDLCPQAGLLAEDLPYVVVEDGKDARGLPFARVYVRAGEGAPGVEVRTLEALIYRQGEFEKVPVEGAFLDLTALLAKHGFARGAARDGYLQDPGLWHWWHFHNLKGLLPGRTTFGMEMLRFRGLGPELLLEWGLGPQLKARWKVEWWG